MNDYNVFVHVGLPKAASTTLQKHLFEKHDALLNLGVYPVSNIGNDTLVEKVDAPYLNDSKVKDFYFHLTQDDELEFESIDPLERLEELFSNHVSDESENIVLSDEKITSTFYSHVDIGLKAQRLKKVFPKARIIIILREQADWIASQYRDHPFDPRNLDIGRPVSVEKWMDIAEWSAEIKLFSMLGYNELVKSYEDLFDADNVCVLLFEELIADLPQFADKISTFMGIDYEQTVRLLQNEHENTGVSALFNAYRGIKRKYLTFGFPGKLYNEKLKNFVEGFARRGGKQHIEISPKYIDKLSAKFSSGNSLLNERRKLGMERYGYLLTDESAV